MFYWAEVAIGVWLIISPWILGANSAILLLWSNTIFGIVLVLAGLWSIYGKEPENQKSNGKK
ncbi:MAG: SPW repeat protein [Candidatus Liptonbacteria bacterium]